MTTPFGAIQTTTGLRAPSGRRDYVLVATRGIFVLTGNAVNVTTVVNNLSLIKMTDSGGSVLTLGETHSGGTIYVAEDLSIASQPLAQMKYVAAGGGVWDTLSLLAVDARIQLRATTAAGTGINPQMIFSDIGPFGVPIFHGQNQAGIGIMANTDARGGSQSPQPLNVNLVNLGAPSGTWGQNRASDKAASSVGSVQLQIWSLADPGDGNSQGVLAFFQGEAAEWNSTFSHTRGGSRLGEIGGFGYCDFGFTVDEVVSINFYAESTFGNTNAGGVQPGNADATCPANMVIRTTGRANGAGEAITHVFDCDGNHWIGDSLSVNANGNVARHSLIMQKTSNPTASANLGGIIWVDTSGNLKYRSPSGTVTQLAAN